MFVPNGLLNRNCLLYLAGIKTENLYFWWEKTETAYCEHSIAYTEIFQKIKLAHWLLCKCGMTTGFLLTSINSVQNSLIDLFYIINYSPFFYSFSTQLSPFYRYYFTLNADYPFVSLCCRELTWIFNQAQADERILIYV